MDSGKAIGAPIEAAVGAEIAMWRPVFRRADAGLLASPLIVSFKSFPSPPDRRNMRNVENLRGYGESLLRPNLRSLEFLERPENSCASSARFRFGARVSLTKLLQIGAEGLL